MKTILFARHAKSNWNQAGISDFERSINEQGQLDAPVMAAYLQQCGYVVHQIISSDAVRAVETANEYKQALTPESGLVTDNSLYLASYNDIAEVIKNISAESSTVMLVGHNPGMTEIVNYYSEGGVVDMPSCSVVIIQFDVSNWSDITIGSGDLLAFEYPKKHS